MVPRGGIEPPNTAIFSRMLYQLSYLGAAQRIVPPSDVGAYRGSRRTCPEPMRTRRTLGRPAPPLVENAGPPSLRRKPFPAKSHAGKCVAASRRRRLAAPASDRRAGIGSPRP